MAARKKAKDILPLYHEPGEDFEMTVEVAKTLKKNWDEYVRDVGRPVPLQIGDIEFEYGCGVEEMVTTYTLTAALSDVLSEDARPKPRKPCAPKR